MNSGNCGMGTGRVAWLGRIVAVLLLVGGTLAATTLMVHDVDVRGKTVGSQIDVPVQVFGLNPATFSAFGLDFAYDRSGLSWGGVSRGPLLAATGGGASNPYAPHWWAIEGGHRAETGGLRVSGMILGRNPGDNTAGGMAPARVPAADGILLVLHFTLLAQGEFPVQLVAGTADGRCVLADDAGNAHEPAGNQLLAGGTMLQGMPNWWALEHFGDPDHDPDADDDGDWRPNAEEYADGTNPSVPDQAFVLLPGWNMLGFQVIPDLSPAEWVAAVNAAYQGRSGDVLLSATVFHFDPGQLRYVVPDRFAPGKAYWFYAFREGTVQFEGAPVPTDYVVERADGWQMVAVPEQVPLGDLGGDIRKSLRWNAGTQENAVLPDAILEPVEGHWLYRWIDE